MVLGYRKGNWKDGKPDGLWESYHENGQLSSKGHYKDGKRDGLWKFYYEDGQLWFILSTCKKQEESVCN